MYAAQYCAQRKRFKRFWFHINTNNEHSNNLVVDYVYFYINYNFTTKGHTKTADSMNMKKKSRRSPSPTSEIQLSINNHRIREYILIIKKCLEMLV